MSISPISPDGQVLSRELSEFLLDFLGAQQRFAMYPVGHPLLDPAVDSLTRRLNTLFLERGSISVAVTPMLAHGFQYALIAAALVVVAAAVAAALVRMPQPEPAR